jgi:hypothetical protein
VKPQATITFELSREGLDDLRRTLDALLGTLGTEDDSGLDDAASAMEAKVEAIRARLGDTSWALLRACAELASDRDEFSLDDVAAAMDRPVADVKAYLRNVGRSEKQLAAGPPLLEKRSDGTRNQYRMRRETREAILGSGAGERQ